MHTQLKIIHQLTPKLAPKKKPRKEVKALKLNEYKRLLNTKLNPQDNATRTHMQLMAAYWFLSNTNAEGLLGRAEHCKVYEVSYTHREKFHSILIAVDLGEERSNMVKRITDTIKALRKIDTLPENIKFSGPHVFPAGSYEIRYC